MMTPLPHRVGMDQGNQFQWLGDEICSPLLFSAVLVLPGRLTRYNRTVSSILQASLNKEFCKKISERLKIQFLFSRSRPPTYSAHDPRPWPLPVRHSFAQELLVFPYRFHP